MCNWANFRYCKGTNNKILCSHLVTLVVTSLVLKEKSDVHLKGNKSKQKERSTISCIFTRYGLIEMHVEHNFAKGSFRRVV